MVLPQEFVLKGKENSDGSKTTEAMVTSVMEAVKWNETVIWITMIMLKAILWQDCPVKCRMTILLFVQQVPPCTGLHLSYVNFLAPFISRSGNNSP
jgi:hypothetical protein